MLYAMVAMIGLIALGSLAVDYGRVQAVKTDLQKAADATAHGCLTIYQAYDRATAQAYGPYLPTAPFNPVESGSGVQPTVTITWGRWDGATKTFTAGAFTPPAVRVTISRTAANNNAVPLTLGAIIGRNTCDVSVTSIATVTSATSTTHTINSTSDPWLSGMPAGSTASYDDTAPGQSPVAINLPAGSTGYLTFSGASGTVAHGPSGSSSGPDGVATKILTHGADSPGGPTPAAENGIADITAPINSIIGVFLNDSAPNASPAPGSRDYSTSTSRDAISYDDLMLKQPFFIGDGQTSSGTTQQFKIPPGATRLFLGPMDGHQWNNNVGSFSITITQAPRVTLVK